MLTSECSNIMNTFLDCNGVSFDDCIAFEKNLIAEKNVDDDEESWNVYILDEPHLRIYEYYFWKDDLKEWSEEQVIEKIEEKTPYKEYVLCWEEV